MAGVTIRLYLLILFLIGLASVGVAWWLWSPVLGPYPFGVPRPPAPAARVSAAAARVYATTLPAIGFERLGIADALDRLREGSGVSIFVNWRALAASGINKDAAVSLHPPTGDLGTTLRALLDQVEASHPGTRLAFTLDEGVLVISTRQDLAKNVNIRVYDVRDVVDPAHVPGSSGSRSLFSTKTGASPATWHGRIDLLFRPDLRSGSTASRTTALGRDIATAVDPTSWRGAGGTVGDIRAINGQLVITQTPENQVEVIYFLQRRRWVNGVAIFAARTVVMLLPVLLLASFLLVVVFRRHRWRRRLAMGHCPSCDYDLRATPARCPECGWASPATAV